MREERRLELLSLAQHLGLAFRDITLLDRALTHASATAEGATTDYEALEFVGDATLGLAVAHFVFVHSPESSPGVCSQMRARVVNQDALAQAARRLDLGPAIWLGKGEENSGGRSRDALLADCLEAVIGATYLDAGWSAAHDFVERALAPELEQAVSESDAGDARSKLQHYCQKRGWDLPDYRLIGEDGPDHAKEFSAEVRVHGEVAGMGRGKSKKLAEQDAARAALHIAIEDE